MFVDTSQPPLQSRQRRSGTTPGYSHPAYAPPHFQPPPPLPGHPSQHFRFVQPAYLHAPAFSGPAFFPLPPPPPLPPPQQQQQQQYFSASPISPSFALVHPVRPLLRRSPSVESDASFLTTSSFLAEHFPQRFFILKCFTQVESDLSVETGLWTTQKHNEDVLNQAFRTSEDVFLIFSVNKSGEFYGYARMTSSTGMNDGSPRITWSPPDSSCITAPPTPGYIPDLNLTSHLSGSIPEPTSLFLRPQSAPSSPIIRPKTDPEFYLAQRHRGTAAEQTTLPEYGSNRSRGSSGSSGDEPAASASQPKSFGHQFKLEWLCTQRLSFRDTKTIRNPWNQDRMVKVSRDGTELEPEAGRALLGAWKRRGTGRRRGFPADQPNKSGTDIRNEAADLCIF